VRKLLRSVVEGSTLKGAKYQVMLALAWSADGANSCSISISDLAMEAHLTKKSVTRALRYLTSSQSSGDPRRFVTKTQRGRGVGLPNSYSIDCELLGEIGRHREYPRETGNSGPAARGIQTPALNMTAVGDTGGCAISVAPGELLTLGRQKAKLVAREIRSAVDANKPPMSPLTRILWPRR
jgi:hypothetical protein